MNVRRKFKHLLKNLQRKAITDKQLELTLQSLGFWGDYHDLNLVLSTKVKPRVLTRIGKAALKKGGFLPLLDVYLSDRYKKELIHQIKFVQVEYSTEVDIIQSKKHFRVVKYLNSDEIRSTFKFQPDDKLLYRDTIKYPYSNLMNNIVEKINDGTYSLENLKTDPFLFTKTLVDKLYKEYKNNPKLIIAVDFDDTIYDYNNNGTTHKYVIDLLKECQELNFYIVVYTARMKKHFDVIAPYMEKIGIKIAAINENAVDLPYGRDGKIYYNILLDDKAGLGQACSALKQVVEIIKAEKQISNKF
jgi:hypothetical protein